MTTYSRQLYRTRRIVPVKHHIDCFCNCRPARCGQSSVVVFKENVFKRDGRSVVRESNVHIANGGIEKVGDGIGLHIYSGVLEEEWSGRAGTVDIVAVRVVP